MHILQLLWFWALQCTLFKTKSEFCFFIGSCWAINYKVKFKYIYIYGEINHSKTLFNDSVGQGKSWNKQMSTHFLFGGKK